MNVNRRRAITAGILGIFPLPFLRRAVGSPARQGNYPQEDVWVVARDVECDLRRLADGWELIDLNGRIVVKYANGFFGIRNLESNNTCATQRGTETNLSEYDRQIRANQIALYLVGAFGAEYAEFRNPEPKFLIRENFVADLRGIGALDKMSHLTS